MNYTKRAHIIQPETLGSPRSGCLTQPSGLSGFEQTDFSWELRLQVLLKAGGKRSQPTVREIPPDMAQEILPQLQADPHWVVTQCYQGMMIEDEEERLCPHCGHPMEVHSRPRIRLQHLPMGHMRSVVDVKRYRYFCPNDACSCRGKSVLSSVPFQGLNHRITIQLQEYIRCLCERGYTQTQIAELTGVDRHIVRAIDKVRLEGRYTETADGRKVLKKPEQQAVILGIDEFKLHNGHEYATLIMDMDTGHILWLQHSRKKQVVYDFIEHVGIEWMRGVKAVCADMNAGFAAAFQEKCPHLEVVYDRFHVIKNFNDMVISEVRKDESKRLKSEGDEEGAKLLKQAKYILPSNRSTLRRKDWEAEEGVLVRLGSDLFRIPEVHRRGGREQLYEQLLANNELLFMADYVKEQLNVAYQLTDRAAMESCILDAVDVCRATGNEHFGKFANLLENHLDGITAHAEYPRSSGKVEGTNNRIKTIRRQAYGYRDDEYFFLKIMDASRHRHPRF